MATSGSVTKRELFSGLGAVADVVLRDDVPARARVITQDLETLYVLDRQWSNAVTGAYSVTNLEKGRRYLITALDYPTFTKLPYSIARLVE